MLRVYVRRGETRPGVTLWARLFPRSLASHITHAALDAGILTATITSGHAGYTRGAKHVTAATSETGFVDLPVCIELVAPRATLEKFMVDHHADLAGGPLVLLQGLPLPSEVSREHEELPA
jgi:PII-like signaling protein